MLEAGCRRPVGALPAALPAFCQLQQPLKVFVQGCCTLLHMPDNCSQQSSSYRL